LNPATAILLAQQLASFLPQAIASYKAIRAELQDASLPPVEDLLAKADSINDQVSATADAEIAKYKQQ